MQTRRHPRTMAEAFGPYTSNDLLPMREPHRPAMWVWFAVYATALIVLAVIW